MYHTQVHNFCTRYLWGKSALSIGSLLYSLHAKHDAELIKLFGYL